ncbi:hypothetical protein VULLAG_LOCUS11332 [Vulpes lagopus]
MPALAVWKRSRPRSPQTTDWTPPPGLRILLQSIQSPFWKHNKVLTSRKCSVFVNDKRTACKELLVFPDP